MYLERRFRRRSDVEIALVNRENYLVFQPLIPEIISASLGIVDTIAPLRRLCPRTHLYTREIQALDLTARTVTLAPAFRPRPLVLTFDILVIALGNITGAGGMPGVQQHALRFKSLGDALHLRNHVLHVLEEAAIESDSKIRQGLTTFVVAGGGFSGVEIAGELNDFVRDIVRDYRGVAPSTVKVILLHSRDRILPELSADLALFAQKVLISRGVEIKLGTRLGAATATAAILATGERIPTRTIVTTVPASPNPLVGALPVQRDLDRLVVDEMLRVRGCPHTWAVGDCAAVRSPVTGELVATTAQYAIRQAKCVADNIAAAVDGRPMQKFAFSGLGSLASLGHRSAVAEILGVKLSGIVAWWLWRTVYLMKLPGWDRKLRVATDWTLDLFLRQDIVQLKIERTAAIAREHFDAGEVVVQQGDFGDKLYFIEAGEAEVVTEDPKSTPERLAILGPGAYFGEMALLTDAPRNATVRTLTAVDALVLGRGDFLALISSIPELRTVFDRLAGTGNSAEPDVANIEKNGT
jgi:NADH:quinone reductase (non-electrogenic)